MDVQNLVLLVCTCVYPHVKFYLAIQYYIVTWIWHLLHLLIVTDAYMLYIYGTCSLFSMESTIPSAVQCCHEVEGFSSLHLLCLWRLSQMICSTGNKQLFHIFIPWLNSILIWNMKFLNKNTFPLIKQKRTCSKERELKKYLCELTVSRLFSPVAVNCFAV